MRGDALPEQHRIRRSTRRMTELNRRLPETGLMCIERRHLFSASSTPHVERILMTNDCGADPRLGDRLSLKLALGSRRECQPILSQVACVHIEDVQGPSRRDILPIPCIDRSAWFELSSVGG